MLPMQTNTDETTETTSEEEAMDDSFQMPPEAYSASRMEEVNLLERNEYHNWTAAAHAEVQTEILKEQTKILREIRDELRD